MNLLLYEPEFCPPWSYNEELLNSIDLNLTKITKIRWLVGADFRRQIIALPGNIGEFFSASLGLFCAVGEQLKAFYNHYQAKGLGPVFLMTVAGIITLTLGFAYLFQYSINNWLSETGKALVVLLRPLWLSGLFC